MLRTNCVGSTLRFINFKIEAQFSAILRVHEWILINFQNILPFRTALTIFEIFTKMGKKNLEL